MIGPRAFRAVVARVAAEHAVPPGLILSRSRVGRCVSARHAAIRAFAAEKPTWSAHRIGEAFGVNHSTVLYVLGRLPGKKERMRERAAARRRGAST